MLLESFLGTGDGARPLTCRTSLTLHSKQEEGATLSMLHGKQAYGEEEDALGATQLVSG